MSSVPAKEILLAHCEHIVLNALSKNIRVENARLDRQLLARISD